VPDLSAAGQPWIADPSNDAQCFARGRLRRAGAPTAAWRGEPARSYAKARAALDRRAAAWLAAQARFDPASFVTWPRQALTEVPTQLARRITQQALAAIGSNPYPPRSARLDRLVGELAHMDRGGWTLAGCLILSVGSDLLICREPAAIAPPMPLEPNRWQRWDRRVEVRLRCDPGSEPPAMVQALGIEGWRQCNERHQGVLRRFPVAVRRGLPSVWQGDRLRAVAPLGVLDPARRLSIGFGFRPERPLAGPPFAVVDASPEPYPWIAANHTFAST
jgi:tRNA(Ile)-lysidine synthase